MDGHRDLAAPWVVGVHRQPDRATGHVRTERRRGVLVELDPPSSAVARYCGHELRVRIRFGGQQAHGYHGWRRPSPAETAEPAVPFVRRWSGLT